MQTANGSIYNSLKSAFRYVEVTAQKYGGLYASDSALDTEPETLENRFIRRAISTKHFNQYLFRDAFSPLNVDYVRKRLGEITLVNTDLRLSAYLYNLMLWAEVHGGKVLNLLLEIKGRAVILNLCSFSYIYFFPNLQKKRRTIYFSISKLRGDLLFLRKQESMFSNTTTSGFPLSWE